MSKSWTGPLVTGLIVVGVAAILLVNFQTRPGAAGPRRRPVAARARARAAAPTAAREPRSTRSATRSTKNHIQVAAVWLSAVTMDGMDPGPAGGPTLIHLEADIKATEDNPNGFAKDEFVPYLKVAYAIVPAAGGPAIEKGELSPMVAWDGLHYGANVLMPEAGRVPPDLRDRAPLGRRPRPAQRPGHRRRPLVGAVPGRVRLDRRAHRPPAMADAR